MHAWRSTNIVLGVLWIAAIGLGLYVLTNYEYAAGTPGSPPLNWPTNTKIKLDSHRATLVMLVHPHCSCSRASISELSELMTREQGKLSTYVLCLSPKDSGQGWEKTDLWYSASAIPGVTVMADTDGAESRHFHAITSGQVMVYGTNGRLLFSGGITGSRGHVGDNMGLQTVASIIDKTPFKRTSALVFGCSLVNPTQEKHAR